MKVNPTLSQYQKGCFCTEDHLFKISITKVIGTMFLILRIIIFALIINIFSKVNAEDVTSNQNYTVEFVNMVNDLTQMSNYQDEKISLIKNVTNPANLQNTKAEIEKIMLVFPNRSFKNKLTQNVTTIKPKIGKFNVNQTSIRNSKIHVQTTRKPQYLIKPINNEKERKLKNLQKLIAEELIKTYNKIGHVQPERPKEIKRVYIRRRKIDKNLSNENTTEHRFVRRETFIKFPTEGLQIIGPIPSGFYGLKSPLTTYDGIRKSDLGLPIEKTKKMLINTGVISPEFLNFVNQKYDDVLKLYEKAVANYNVYNELYNKAKELGTI